MLRSIADDIRGEFQYGNRISQLILVNFFVFLVIIILKAFSVGGGQGDTFRSFMAQLALPIDFGKLLTKPWTVVTHIFVHQSIWHFAWNMILLYFFGRIIGDLLGDKRVVPLYFLGGLFGALICLFMAPLLGYHGGIAYGASAAVMAFVTAAGFLAPDYNIRLLIIGDVKLKYIVLFYLVLDLSMIAEMQNVGGRIAHLGGAGFGALFIYALRKGIDMGELFEIKKSKKSTLPKSKLKVVHNTVKKTKVSNTPNRHPDLQKKVDEILDKINQHGYDSLSEQDKETLRLASKQD